MSSPEELSHALLTAEASAEHLKRIGRSHDEEFEGWLCEIARNLGLIAGFLKAVSEMSIIPDKEAA